MVSLKLFYLGLVMSSVLAGKAFSEKKLSDKRRTTAEETKLRQLIREDFISSLKGILFNLPENAFCRLLGKFLREKDYDTVTRNLRSPLSKSPIYESRVKSCQEERMKYRKEAASHKNNEVDLESILTRLYNRLPLPFQCNVLISTTLNQIGERSKSKVEYEASTRQPRPSIFPILLSDTKSKARLKSRNKIVKLLSQTEKKLNSNQDIIPIARQCGKLLLQRSAYSNAIKFVIKKTNTTNIYKVKKMLSKKVPKILENYAIDRGIDVRIDPRDYRTLQCSFHMIYTEQEDLPDKFILYAIVHLFKGGRAPENANFVLNSLFDYGKSKLEQELEAHVKFTAVMNKSKMSLRKRYVGRQYTFPEYLTRYFRGLQTVQKCFIIQMLSVYSNKSNESIIDYLVINEDINTTICAHPLNHIRRTTPLVSHHTNMKPTIDKVNSTLSANLEEMNVESGMTILELLTIVALSCVIVCSILFVGVLSLFCYRKHRYRSRNSDYLNPYNINDSDLHEYYKNIEKKKSITLNEVKLTDSNLNMKKNELMTCEHSQQSSESFKNRISDYTTSTILELSEFDEEKSECSSEPCFYVKSRELDDDKGYKEDEIRSGLKMLSANGSLKTLTENPAPSKRISNTSQNYHCILQDVINSPKLKETDL